MRTITLEQIEQLDANPVYRRIMDAKPDHARLKRVAGEFARWIAMQHKKEEARLAAKPAFA